MRYFVHSRTINGTGCAFADGHASIEKALRHGRELLANGFHAEVAVLDQAYDVVASTSGWRQVWQR